MQGTPAGQFDVVRGFHATKELDSTRVVRAVSQVAEEINGLFTTRGISVRVTVDLESQELAALPLDQIDALKENLSTLGFADWNVE